MSKDAESSLDQELDRVWSAINFPTLYTKEQYKADIKQAIDEYIIGKDYEETDFSDGSRGWDNDLKPQINYEKSLMRKALYNTKNTNV